MQVEERQFELPGYVLAAREWGRQGQLPVIALHGWLDNAGSFDLLAPRLSGCHIIALDAAGHGFSGNRSVDAAYNIWQDVGDVCEVARQLGWERFTLIGHSRGAAIATLLAGTFPELVQRLVLVEGAIPILAAADQAPENLARAYDEQRRLRDKTGRVFADRETALSERVNGFSPVTSATADILARRSLRQVAGGYRWHADQRLKARSEVQLTPAQIRAFIERVTAPVLLFLAENSPFAGRPVFQEMLTYYADLTSLTLPGDHHLHLEGAEIEIGARVRVFLGLEAPGH